MDIAEFELSHRAKQGLEGDKAHSGIDWFQMSQAAQCCSTFDGDAQPDVFRRRALGIAAVWHLGEHARLPERHYVSATPLEVRHCTAGRGKGPRLHDLRATFAVHRLETWYRPGEDLDAKLPILSVYMGHRGMAGTQHYLRLTPSPFPDVSTRLETTVGHVIPRREVR